MKTISQVASEARENELNKGFTDDVNDYNVRAAKVALIHSEASELLEEFRSPDSAMLWHNADGKPMGAASELADIVIRTLGFAHALGIDIQDVVEQKMAYNATRAHKHGKSF